MTETARELRPIDQVQILDIQARAVFESTYSNKPLFTFIGGFREIVQLRRRQSEIVQAWLDQRRGRRT